MYVSLFLRELLFEIKLYVFYDWDRSGQAMAI